MLIRNNLFDDFFGDMFDDPFFNRGYAPQNQLMKTDIRERDGQYLLEIEVPGFTKEDVKAELKNGYLTITADRKEPEAGRTGHAGAYQPVRADVQRARHADNRRHVRGASAPVDTAGL